MPHVYMSTMGPGSKATTSWRAVQYSRIGASSRGAEGAPLSLIAVRASLRPADPSHASFAQVDPGELHPGPRLVAHVQLQQHGGEGLDGGGVGELTGVEGAHVRQLLDDLDGRLGGRLVVRADEHVAVDRVGQ